jgi:hypothetical protein
MAAPVALWLACCDAPFADLAPPTIAPAQAFYGPGLYGFRIASS